MITKSSNQALLIQIAKLFYPTNRISYAGLISRLNLYLNDALFENVISQISYGQYMWNKMTKVTVDAGNRVVHYKTQFGDLFRGGSSIGEIRGVPLSKLNDWNFIFNKVNLVYLGETIQSNGVHVAILQNANAEGYGIIYDPLGGGQGGSGTGGSGTGGSGEVTLTPPIKTGETTPAAPMSSIFGNLDLNSLLLPGIVLLAAYFFIKK